MYGHYDISIERSHQLLNISLGGFFSSEDVAGFLAAKNAALSRLDGQHVTLCDVSDCKLQSQEVVAEFQTIIGDPRYLSRRIAIVTGSSLARMQIRRMLTRDNSGCFDTVEEARTWLLRPETKAAA